jgi:hygromycin-B 4-O-kinase
MSKLKTKISEGEAQYFLENIMGTVSELNSIAEGEISQAFSFKTQKNKEGELGEFVIRFNTKQDGFAKDVYAYRQFNSLHIPVPAIIKQGKAGRLYYLITEKAEGKIIDEFTKAEIRKIVPALMQALNAIHNFPIGETKFGDWNGKGVAKNDSWKNYLLRFLDRFEKYKNSNGKKILEKKVVDKILEIFKQLIPDCPEERRLVHGDYGFNNLLSDGKRITGVIDWELGKYGDFLFDVAWLSFWEEELDYLSLFKRDYEKRNIFVPKFEQRILCYKLMIGLDALNFYSESEQKEKYEKTKKKIFDLNGF